MATQSRFTGTLVYRQKLATRLTHWIWAACLFFLLLSGLQIFQARPDLYIGQQSGFGFDNTFLSIGAFMDGNSMKGFTAVFGHRFETTGWLGAIWENGNLTPKSFPGWMTIPSYRDLGTGRIVHFFFAWILVATLAVWLVASLINRHIKDLAPSGQDFKDLPEDVAKPCQAAVSPREPLQHPAEARLYRRPLRRAAADDPDRPHHVAGLQRMDALDTGSLRRPPDCPLDPLRHDAGARPVFRRPYPDGWSSPDR